MPKLIQDKFTSRSISRQRKYQLRREERGLCRICGAPVATTRDTQRKLCALHLAEARGHARDSSSPPLPPIPADLLDCV